MSHSIRIKDHEKDARLVRVRLVCSVFLVVGLIAILIARLYYLQVIQYDYHSTLSESNRVHVQPIPPTRGLIFDRTGVMVVDNRPSFSLSMTSERSGDWRQILDVIVNVLQLTPEDRMLFEKRMKHGRRPFEPVPILFDLNEEQIAWIAVNQFRLPGVEVVAQLVRHYPQGMHFAHSVGYMGRINEKELKTLEPVNYSGTHHIGKAGIERFYEPELHGQVGYEEVETNARGRVLRVLKRTDPIPGKDIVLSLDIKLQEAAEIALGGRRGAVVALDPRSGEVLAMVSQPSFDPNLFVTGISFKAYAELRDSIDRPLLNRVLRGLYPPGSTIKPAVAIAGLDSGVITSSDRVFDPGYYMLPNYNHKYRNWNRTGDGYVDLETALMRSNDTYFYELANKLGIDRLSVYMSKFGLGRKVSMDMFEESPGLMPSREWKRTTIRQAWFPGETLILGIGQGYMQTTPLQLAQATALVANKGVWNRPHLVKTIEGEKPLDKNPIPDIVLRNPSDWTIVNNGMQQVMHGARGTARKAAVGAQYRIAGKSGTAQVVAIKQGEKYDRSKVHGRHLDHALFVGFAPADDPKIAVAVMVENGESGSRVAAPVVRQVMDAWLLTDDGRLK
ncbi:penicillin-binding protein 2 [Candidatus Pseudomonas adelgestsugas]|uniref:Peptidoglycan D,D-transpeptidase MrdA n=1 Tax=Candidatus Pseudomonas adelgestsugas TaxID=1302376 RepID=A0ABX5R7Q8_9PSED|nr:penicillin-binding protein 2 [Candidatus Pseudomonas adelgestsugas]QAX81680.1 Stage V sporulation protein D [Candidatus Pseudomonas adelgestsugas]